MGRTHLATCVVALGSCAAAVACSNGSTAADTTAVRSVIQTPSALAASVRSSSSSGPLYGVNNDIMLQTHANHLVTIPMSQSLHATVVRTSLKFGDIEGTKGSPSWSGTDAAMSDIASSGIAVLAVLWGSPSWANGSSDQVYVPTSSSSFSSWVSQYASFASAAATRYKGKIKYYELWNEENIQDCWHPNPNVSQYITWYKAVYAAIKAADPNAQVGMGGVTNLAAGGSSDINGETFLTDLYNAGVYPDAVVIHPYAPQGNGPTTTLQWQDNFSDIATIHNIMESHGQGSKQLWLTEWGWQAGQVGTSNQATYISQALNLIATTYNYVTLSTLFLQQDYSGYTYGLYESNGTERTSGYDFASFAASH
jgi:polysaccharide biosynthesis protein PslG